MAVPIVRHHLLATGLALAGFAFAAYPALRPYGPETGVAGAAGFASGEWLASHVLGMSGFVALALVLRAASVAPPWRWSGQPVRRAETRMWLAVALLLPYYGAEAYGLHAVGRYAVDSGDPGVLDVAEGFRYAPFEVGSFAVGLLLLVLVGGRLAHGLWRAGTLARAGGLMTGLGLATYLPQFFGAPAVRVAHGLVLGAGLLLVAVATVRAARAEEPTGAVGVVGAAEPLAVAR